MVNLAQENAKSSSREHIGYVDMKSVLLARQHWQIAQPFVRTFWNAATSALEPVASVAWVEFTYVARTGTSKYWFVLMSTRHHAQNPARHVRCRAKTDAVIRLAKCAFVGRRAVIAPISAIGIVPILDVTSYVVNCAIAQDVISPAKSSSNAEVGLIAAEACAERSAFVLCVTKTMAAQSPKYFSVEKTKKVHVSFSFRTANISSQ